MVKKEITFIYADQVEKQVDEMIAAEAEKRGYKTCFTNDRFAKCEIGWYCDHFNFPQNSKFSIIMLHDITQRYLNWPDIWYIEPWNIYDIGFLPSLVWIDNWNQCSQYDYANPKQGMYLAGWPKADRLMEYLSVEKKNEIIQRMKLDPAKKTILYAPAWENDGKQDDFVQAMLKLDVNILIKQAPWPDTYPDQIRNVEEMRKLHEGMYRVTILDPKTSIFDAILVSDVLVSEESSTMCESVMMGKPAVSVCDWPIPLLGTNETRFAPDDYEFAVKTKKNELTRCISHILDDYDTFQKKAKDYSETHFSNIGKCIPLMMDIVDSYVEGKICGIEPLKRQKRKRIGIKRKTIMRGKALKQLIYFKYREKNKFTIFLWDVTAKIIHLASGRK